MSERFNWKVGVAYSWTIVVENSAGVGQTGRASLITTKLMKDNVFSSVPVTVTEIDATNLPGWYAITYTPTALGHWENVAVDPTFGKAGWLDGLQVTQRVNDDFAYPNSPNGNVTADVEEWLGDTPNPLVFGRVDASVGDMQTNTITSATFASGTTLPASVMANVTAWLGTAPNALVSGRVDANVGAVTAGAITAAAFAAGALAAVWDELLTAHTVAGSFGLLVGSMFIRSGTCQSGSTSSSIVIDAGASGTNAFYNYAIVVTTGGLGAGQVRPITAYNGTTKTLSVSPNWTTIPDNTTTFMILSVPGVTGIDWADVVNPGASVNLSGTTVAIVSALANGAITSATFAAGALGAVWDELTASHTGAGSFGLLVGTNLNATVSSRATPAQILVTPGQPIATDASGNVSLSSATESTIAGAVWDALVSSHTGAGTFGLLVGTDLDAKISTRATPAQILANPANLLATDASGNVSLSAATENAIATAVWALAGAIDGTLTPAQALMYIFATTVYLSAGEPGPATTDTFKGPSGTVRVTTTFDANNNRTNVVLG